MNSPTIANAAVEQEFSDGYRDGYNLDHPAPGANRTDAYKHSFEIARREANHEPPIPAHISRRKAAEIENNWIETSPPQ